MPCYTTDHYPLTYLYMYPCIINCETIAEGYKHKKTSNTFIDYYILMLAYCEGALFASFMINLIWNVDLTTPSPPNLTD